MKSTSVFSRPARSLATLIVGLMLAAFAPARAQLTITLPTVPNLQPNMAGQTFDVSISNSGSAQPVTGIGFNIEVADGGPPAGGSILGPAITQVDVITGTIFAPNNNGAAGSGQIVPQVFNRETQTSLSTVDIPAGGPTLIATVTVDTTGFSSGSWTMTLDTVNGPAKFTTTGSDLFPTLVNGSLTILPEPGVYALLAGVACMVFAVVRRHKS